MATQPSIHARIIPMDRGSWRATVPGVAELDTRSDRPHMCGKYLLNENHSISTVPPITTSWSE